MTINKLKSIKDMHPQIKQKTKKFLAIMNINTLLILASIHNEVIKIQGEAIDSYNNASHISNSNEK